MPDDLHEIDEAFRALATTLDIAWKLEPCLGLDAIALVSVQGVEIRAGIELRRHLRDSMLGRLREELRHAAGSHGLPTLLCTDYADSRMAKTLREVGIQFIDKAGNAYLDQPGFFVLVHGEPKPAGVYKRQRAGRAFQPAGLRLVFELMRDPRLAGRTYRELAGIAGVSLTAVKFAMDDLTDKGFVREGGGDRRRVVQLKRLLDEWSIAYRDRLRPRLLRGLYAAEKPDWWQNADLTALPGCWGGEVAATKLGLMRHPQVHSVYSHGKVNALIAQGRLRPAEDGNVEVLDAFWKSPDGALAPDLLIYADLVTSGDERNMETARELHARRIEDNHA